MTTFRSIGALLCPECGGYAIASAMEQDAPTREHPEPTPRLLDRHWCNTAGCKHHHKTGQPWGRDADA